MVSPEAFVIVVVMIVMVLNLVQVGVCRLMVVLMDIDRPIKVMLIVVHVFISIVVKVLVMPVALVITEPVFIVPIPVVLMSVVVLVMIVLVALVFIVGLIVAGVGFSVAMIVFIEAVTSAKGVGWLCMVHMMLVVDWLFVVAVWLGVVFLNLVLLLVKIGVVVIESWMADSVPSAVCTWGQLVILDDFLFDLGFLHFELKEAIFDGDLGFEESGAVCVKCHVVRFEPLALVEVVEVVTPVEIEALRFVVVGVSLNVVELGLVGHV